MVFVNSSRFFTKISILFNRCPFRFLTKASPTFFSLSCGLATLYKVLVLSSIQRESTLFFRYHSNHWELLNQQSVLIVLRLFVALFSSKVSSFVFFLRSCYSDTIYNNWLFRIQRHLPLILNRANLKQCSLRVCAFIEQTNKSNNS